MTREDRGSMTIHPADHISSINVGSYTAVTRLAQEGQIQEGAVAPSADSVQIGPAIPRGTGSTDVQDALSTTDAQSSKGPGSTDVQAKLATTDTQGSTAIPWEAGVPLASRTVDMSLGAQAAVKEATVPVRTVTADKPTPPTVPVTLTEGLDQDVSGVLVAAAAYHRDQAYDVMDRFLTARDTVTGLLPLHVRTENGRLVAADHVASGLDMGRQTSGLVMTAMLADAQGDSGRARRYLDAAEVNYENGKQRLAQGDAFVHLRDFDDDGSVKSTQVGEPGMSALGQDDMTRINPRGYAFRGAADLYQATGRPEYKADLERYLDAWVRDFHDDAIGGFFIHGSVTHRGDHTERNSFKGIGGVDSSYDGSLGAKGNDATIYALSGVLLPANQVLGTSRTQALVREQMDLILDRFHRQNGMLWENYTTDFRPVSLGWQSQPRMAEEGQSAPTSHVAIGGHTAMAAQQIVEGARQLRGQGAISEAQYTSYVDRTVAMFGDFAAHSGAIDWDTGAVHNAIRVEEPDASKRWIREWGDAGWQQAELLQSLLVLREEGRLQDIRGPQGKTGHDLLALAEQHYQSTYAVKSDYAFDGFGNPDVYHIPQVATYFQHAASEARGR